MRLARFVVVVVVVVTDIKEALATVTINGMFLSFLFSSRNLVSLISSRSQPQHKALPVRTHFIEPQRRTSIHTQNGYIAEHTNVRETGVWRMSEIA